MFFFVDPGARRFAGYGCWIKVPHCPKDPTVPRVFFDAWGDTNRNTGNILNELVLRLSRAVILCSFVGDEVHIYIYIYIPN